ncbi:MAG: ATP-binding cassette domain-containing protein [Psychrobium sp.]|nr:ATP-binding cassette domain-containing protein [Psychrobium sp.]
MLAAALQLKDIFKHYQQVEALGGACLTVAAGSIHGIIGENGAGKSTLMQVAYGVTQPDSGEIVVDGAVIKISSAQVAIKHGIGMLHQRVSWLDEMSVLENIVLGDEIKSYVYQDLTKARQELEQLRREFGFSFSLDVAMTQLNYSERQLVDILRSLYRGVRILILDEPMALLSPDQADYLTKLLVMLKLQGISVIIVSHKLASLHQLCDVISVLSNGKVVHDVRPSSLSLGQLSKLMVGREIVLPHASSRNKQALTHAPLLNVSNLTVYAQKRGRRVRSDPLLEQCNLSLFGGEIVAIAGLPNAGQELLLDVIAGLHHFNRGSIELFGKEYRAKNHYCIAKARKLGVAYAPNPTLEIGLIGQLSMIESSFLGYQSKGLRQFSLFNPSIKKQHCINLMKQWRIRPLLAHMLSGNFSGGNQQKMVLARELSRQPKLLLLNQPTQGVDAGAVEYVYQQLFALRDNGGCILFCSSDLDEMISLSDRIVIIEQGKVVTQVLTADIDKAQLGLLLVKEVLQQQPRQETSTQGNKS